MEKGWQSLKTHVRTENRYFASRLWRIKRSVGDESGSASVEFVLLALPLFIPIFIFLNQFSTLSSQEMALQTLARESVRAFVESKDDRTGGALVNQVINLGGAKLGLKPEEVSEIQTEIKCSTSPCHLPNGRVRITLRMSAIGNDGRSVEASAQQYFSPWSS
jgi:hypothetical protein